MFDNLRADLRHYSRFCYNGRPVLRVLVPVLWAGAVLTKSGPRDAIVAGVPARILRFREPGEDLSENRTLPNRPSEWLVCRTEAFRSQHAQTPGPPDSPSELPLSR
jgi:hypothetical protein